MAASHGRAVRVVMLLAVVVVLSLADLYMTLAHVTGAGMLEENPLARRVMAFDSPALVVAWKGATAGIGVALLFAIRRRLSAELGAWACVLILTWLTIRWEQYAAHVADLTPYLPSMAEVSDGQWVAMSRG